MTISCTITDPGRTGTHQGSELIGDRTCGHACACAMRNGKGATAREMRETIYREDRQMLVDRCWVKASVIAEVARRVGWARLWDATLDIGGKAVRGLQMLSRVMSHHGRGSRPCPLCDAAALQSSVLDHILEHHRGELFLEPELGMTALLHANVIKFEI